MTGSRNKSSPRGGAPSDATAGSPDGDRVCLGVITGAHGVRGLVKVKSFTETPEDIAAYGPLSDAAGKRRFALALKGRAKDALLASIEGVGDRDTAQAMRGTQLTVERAALPAIEEEETFYHADLEGLAAEDPEGRPLGRVKAVHNHGAGDLLEIQPPAGADATAGPGAGVTGSFFLPFTLAAVPEVDLAGGRVVVRPPEEIEAGPEPGKEPEPGKAPEAEKDEGD